MPSLTTAVHWLDTHALSIAVALATATGILRALYALASRVLAPYPRARAFVEAVAAMAPDFLRFAQQVFRLLTGRDLPSTQPASIAPALPADAVVLRSPTTAATLAGEVALQPPAAPRETMAPPPPAAPAPLRAVTLTGVADPLLASARRFVAQEIGEAFDPARTQDVTHAAQTARAILDPAPPANDREGES